MGDGNGDCVGEGAVDGDGDGDCLEIGIRSLIVDSCSTWDKRNIFT